MQKTGNKTGPIINRWKCYNACPGSYVRRFPIERQNAFQECEMQYF
jgi:hypothetical protein